MNYEERIAKARLIKKVGYTKTRECDEVEALFEDYDKDDEGNALSCCGDVLTEENGGICESCGEHC